MKLNPHNNPPISNGGRKAKGKPVVQMSKPKHHDPARTETNKQRHIEAEKRRQEKKQAKWKRLHAFKETHCYHGWERDQRRINAENEAHARQILIDNPQLRLSKDLTRQEMIQQGLIKPAPVL
jgi:hypothetical protein